MYRVHKREARELAEEARMQEKYKQLSPDGAEIIPTGDSIMNGTVISPASTRVPELESPVLRGRFGSVRKSSLPGLAGFVNPAYVPPEGEVIHETIEIMKDLPVLHVEHCTLWCTMTNEF